MKVQEMTVAELRRELFDLPEEFDSYIVVVAENEGNAFSPLSSIEPENNVYVPDVMDNGLGELKLHHLTPYHVAQRYTEEDVYGYTEDPDWDPPDTNGKRCVVLWPVH